MDSDTAFLWLVGVTIILGVVASVLSARGTAKLKRLGQERAQQAVSPPRTVAEQRATLREVRAGQAISDPGAAKEMVAEFDLHGDNIEKRIMGTMLPANLAFQALAAIWLVGGIVFEQYAWVIAATPLLCLFVFSWWHRRRLRHAVYR